MIALQCCVNFCYTTMWISCLYAYMASLVSLLPTLPQAHPSRSSQSTELSSLLLLLLRLSRFSLSDSVRPHRRQPTRLPHPWDSPGKNTGVGCHFLLQCRQVKSEREVAQSCPTLSDPMNCSPPGSSLHGIFQAGVLEWGAIAFSIQQLASYFTHSSEYMSVSQFPSSSSPLCP